MLILCDPPPPPPTHTHSYDPVQPIVRDLRTDTFSYHNPALFWHLTDTHHHFYWSLFKLLPPTIPALLFVHCADSIYGVLWHKPRPVTARSVTSRTRLSHLNWYKMKLPPLANGDIWEHTMTRCSLHRWTDGRWSADEKPIDSSLLVKASLSICPLVGQW